MQVKYLSENIMKVVFCVIVCWILEVESRSKRRCKSSEIDILTSTGVKIEPISLSRVHIPDLTKEFGGDGHKMSFTFRTTSPSGLLFYGIQSMQHRVKLVALQMVDGRIYFIVRCSSADVELRLPVSGRLDDGKWHSIEFRRKGRKGFITIDGRPYFRHYPVTCKLRSFVFGGLEREHARALLPLVRTMDHFDGCISNLNFNHAIVDSSPKYYAVSICS